MPTHPTVPYQQLPLLVQLLLSVAKSEGPDLDPHEHEMAVEIARLWAPSADPAAVRAVVETASVAVRPGAVGVEALVTELAAELDTDASRRLLTDLGVMACADGHLTRDEAVMIGRARTVLLDRSPVLQAA